MSRKYSKAPPKTKDSVTNRMTSVCAVVADFSPSESKKGAGIYLGDKKNITVKLEDAYGAVGHHRFGVSGKKFTAKRLHAGSGLM